MLKYVKKGWDQNVVLATDNLAILAYIIWLYLCVIFDESVKMYEDINDFLEDIYVWYINLEIKLDIVEDYYQNVPDIITCSIVRK